MNESEKMYIEELIAQERYYEVGKKYLEFDEYDKAKKLFEYNINNVPYEAWEKLAYKFLENNKIEDAIECFDNTIEDGYQLVGEYFFEKKEYVKAKEYFEKAIFTQDEVWQELGEYFLKENSIEDAIECFNRTYNIKEKIKEYCYDRNYYTKLKKYFEMDKFDIDYEDWEKLAYKFLENNKIEDAIECFDNTIEDGYQLIGEYFFEKKEYVKAKEYFEKAIFTQDEVWLKLAKKFIEKNDENTAYDCFYYTIRREYHIVEHLLSKDDEIEDNEKICYYLKNIFFEFIDKNSVDHIFSLYLEKSENIQNDKFMENFEELIENLVNNTNYQDTQSHLYFILAKFYLNKNNRNKARTFFDKCEHLNYKDCDFYLQIANFYIKLDFYKSKQYFIKFIKLFKEKENSQDMQKYFEKEIFISLLLKEYDITKKYLGLAIKENSDDIYNALNEFTNNNYDKCIDILENIQEKNNNIVYNLKDLILAICYYKKTKLGQARQIIEENLKQDQNNKYLKEILNLQMHITLANIYNEQKEDTNSEKQCLKALEIDYTNQEVFDILLSLYEKDINLFIESNTIDIINNIIKNNREYNKTVFCHLLKNFILDFKRIIIQKQQEDKKLENLMDKFYELFDIYLKIDHKSIYQKVEVIENEDLKKYIRDIYIISEEILKIQEFTFDEKNQELAHYTSKAGAMAILGEGARIRLKNTIYANDPQEGEFLKKIIISNEPKKFEDSKAIDLKKYNNKNVYFSCFSTNIDGDASLPMWVHYADKTEGCILVFDNEFLGDNNIISSEIKTNLSISKLYKVVYLKDEDINIIQYNDNSEDNIINLLIELKNKIKKVETLKSKKDEDYNIARDTIDEIIEYTSFIFKKSHFEYEQEVRLLKRVDDTSKVKIDNKIVPELYVDFEKKVKCKEVILGAKCNDIDAIARFLAYRNINSCKKSRLTYR